MRKPANDCGDQPRFRRRPGRDRNGDAERQRDERDRNPSERVAEEEAPRIVFQRCQKLGFHRVPTVELTAFNDADAFVSLDFMGVRCRTTLSWPGRLIRIDRHRLGVAEALTVVEHREMLAVGCHRRDLRIFGRREVG